MEKKYTKVDFIFHWIVQMKKRTISNAYLITPAVMVNKENYYGEYKGYTKWLSLINSHFAKNFFLA